MRYRGMIALLIFGTSINVCVADSDITPGLAGEQRLAALSVSKALLNANHAQRKTNSENEELKQLREDIEQLQTLIGALSRPSLNAPIPDRVTPPLVSAVQVQRDKAEASLREKLQEIEIHNTKAKEVFHLSAPSDNGLWSALSSLWQSERSPTATPMTWDSIEKLEQLVNDVKTALELPETERLNKLVALQQKLSPGLIKKEAIPHSKAGNRTPTLKTITTHIIPIEE